MRILYLFFGIFLFFSFASYANSGKAIFDSYCTVCHSPSMAAMFNAPAAHDMSAWNDRKENAFSRAIANDNSIKDAVGEKKEIHIINELVKTANSGTDKGMPPKGTCTDCTDDDLKSVIKYMSSSE